MHELVAIVGSILVAYASIGCMCIVDCYMPANLYMLGPMKNVTNSKESKNMSNIVLQTNM